MSHHKKEGGRQCENSRKIWTMKNWSRDCFFEANEEAKAPPAVFGKCLLRVNPYRAAQEVAGVLFERPKSLRGNEIKVAVESVSSGEVKS